ncbi:MAG TPA: VOC family protein [Gemmatimonadales bacterium]|nr:VOC family protein [Gemmatimonadales bacterium]
MATKKKSAKKRAPAPRARGPKRVPRKQPETLRLRSVSASFTVADLDKSVAFYRDIVGFVVSDRWEHQGRVMGVELRAGDVMLMLNQDDWSKGRDRQKGEGFRVYVRTAQKVDEIANRIKAKGGMLTLEPRDMEWGERAFALQDPDGFKITFVQVR